MGSSLEERLEVLERRMTVLEDTGRIERLMARYQVLEGAGEGGRLMDELWTREKPDPTHEYGAGGVYRGLDEISPFYCRGRKPGVWQFHPLHTPAVEILPDGLTARGSWTSLGIELDAGECGTEELSGQPGRVRLLSGTGADSKRFCAEWVIQTYHVEFTKENGEWRIWHMHISEPARTPFYEDWIQFAKRRFDTDGIRLDEYYKTYQACVPGGKPENIAAEPTTWHWQYTCDGTGRLPEEEDIQGGEGL